MLMRDCGLDAGLEMDILSIFLHHREQFSVKSSNKSRLPNNCFGTEEQQHSNHLARQTISSTPHCFGTDPPIR
jgi:hypothetical protein